jgi:iron complex outermembrane receptor protein
MRKSLFLSKSLAATTVRIGLALGLCITAFSLPALAQETEEEEPEVTEGDQVFGEEITVTSRKREEDLQDVPFSVAAQTEETLRSRGAENIEDISANVAGFNVQNLGPGQSQVAMRGVASGQIARDQPGVKEQVGIYLDESVISLSLFTPDIDLFDMSRIEVLRGPQGTLFGSGSLSGTVRYITNQPEIGVSDSFGEFTLNTVDDGGVGGSVKVAGNVPLGETSALRLTAYHTSYGGFMDAVQPDLSVDEDVNSGDRTGVRLAVRAQPNDQLTITPRIIYQEVSMDGWNRKDAFNVLANPFTTTRPAVDLGERQLFTQQPEPYTDEFLLMDLTIEYDFGPAVLTSITSYTDRDVLVVRDATALTGYFTGFGFGFSDESVFTIDAPLIDATEAEVITQEFRLSGSSDRREWVAGVFYSNIERIYGQTLFPEGFTAAAFATDPELATSLGLPFQGPTLPSPDHLFFSGLGYDFEQLAVFGEVTHSVNDQFDLTLGLRWYDFSEDRVQTFDGFFSPFSQVPGTSEADGFAPRLIASYEVNEETTLNAQVSKGFRLGGINDPLNIPLCSPEDVVTFGGRDSFEDEEVWNYEVGSKSTIMGGRGTFNIAAFYMDIADLQATVTAGTCSSRLVFNVPEAESTGLELEVAATPSEHFDFAISASYTDSVLQSEAAGNISGISPGNRMPTVPEFQGAAAATWQRHMQGERLGYLTAVFQHVGSRYTQTGDFADGFGTVNVASLDGGPLTQPIFTFNPELPAYDILNLRFGVTSEKWDVALFVNNVTDEIALLALDQEAGSAARVGFLTNQPRTFGVSARVNF